MLFSLYCTDEVHTTTLSTRQIHLYSIISKHIAHGRRVNKVSYYAFYKYCLKKVERFKTSKRRRLTHK